MRGERRKHFQDGKPVELDQKGNQSEFPSDGILVGTGVLVDDIGLPRLPITLITDFLKKLHES